MTSVQSTDQRTPLSRPRILDAALRYIDEHGLDALSMHKLGAELGVKGMSLYNHVANKDDILDGVVEMLWGEVEDTAPANGEWRDAVRALAHATRNMVHRHPNAAPLITSQSIMPSSALRVVRAHVAVLISHGVPEEDAYAVLRTITSYTLGSSLNEVAWGDGQPGCAPAVSDLLRPGTPDELASVAQVFCGQYDLGAQFELGLDLMLRGIESRGCSNTNEAP
jgi:TetR/AcrR family tetracycline transcriptional repressor